VTEGSTSGVMNANRIFRAGPDGSQHRRMFTRLTLTGEVLSAAFARVVFKA
jgi:hypothetical protein